MFIDIIVLFLILIFAAFGVFDGFVVSVLKLAAWFFGIVAIWFFASSLASFLSANVEGLSHFPALALGAIIAFMGTFLLFRMAASIAEHFLKKTKSVKTADRVLGGVFGALKGIIVCVIILSLVYLIPSKGSLKAAIDSSVSCSIYAAIPIAKSFKSLAKN
jgi:membrane protein required for colicin V production